MRINNKVIIMLIVIVSGVTISCENKKALGFAENIYYEHDNINAQSRMIAAMEEHKFDEAFSVFIDEAEIGTANFGPDPITNSAGSKAYRIKFHTEYFDVLSMDVARPSIYIENEDRKGGDVLSWYTFHLVRKSDKKEIKMPIHMVDSFNEEGKIIAEYAYYSNSLIYIGGESPNN